MCHMLNYTLKFCTLRTEIRVWLVLDIRGTTARQEQKWIAQRPTASTATYGEACLHSCVQLSPLHWLCPVSSSVLAVSRPLNSAGCVMSPQMQLVQHLHPYLPTLPCVLKYT